MFNTKFEIGDKAIFIKSNAGNEGKIIEVIGFFDEQNDTMYEHKWRADLVVKTLGSALNSFFGEEQFKRDILPVTSSFLRKLPKVEDDQPALKEMEPLK